MGIRSLVVPGGVAAPPGTPINQRYLTSEDDRANTNFQAIVQPSDSRSIVDECHFAHPTERDLARILSFYGVRWVYEPTTFRLVHDDRGFPKQQITPDFYLPDHDLFIELTSMRQCLVTRKNRKVRKLREVFPSVQIKMVYRRDYDRIVGSHTGPTGSGSCFEPGDVVFNAATVADQLDRLAGELEQSPIFRDGDQSVLLLGLGRGSRKFLNLLERRLRNQGQRIATDWISLTRRERRSGEQRVRIGRKPSFAVEGQRVLLVSDIVSTGLSASYVRSWLNRKGAIEIQLCTMLDRAEARILDVPIAASALSAPHELLAGFGIPLQGRFADLPDVCAIKTLH